MSPASVTRIYPRSWRARYGDEMNAVLEARRPGWRDAIDLARGALDAWLHPPTPSRVPAATALVGGGLWTIVAAGIIAQPGPLDWPGYLFDLVPVALVAAMVLLVATLGCRLRTGDAGGRGVGLASLAVIVGSVAWIAALALTTAGLVGGTTLAAGHALAMLGMIATGLVLIRTGDEIVGGLLLVGSVSMLIPWTGGWLVFGAAWTCIGIYLVTERITDVGGDLRPS